MTLERTSNATSIIDVLDHVIDKGIVIDAWVNVSVAGIELITVEARVLVASFETYLKHAHAFAHAPFASRPRVFSRVPGSGTPTH